MDYLNEHLAPIVAALTALLAAAATFSIRRLNRQDTLKDRFRAAFADDVLALRESLIKDHGQVYELLQAAYPRHEIAYLEYQKHLGRIRRWRLKRRWLAYRGPYPKPPELPEEDQRYRLAHWIGTSVAMERQIRDAAIKTINQLIQ